MLQASWVKMGPERAAQLLDVGCNDMGGSIMNESITKAAGLHARCLPCTTGVCRLTLAAAAASQQEVWQCSCEICIIVTYV